MSILGYSPIQCRDIIKEEFQHHPPVDVLRIADRFRIDVSYVYNWIGGISGKITRSKDKERTFAIEVNGNHPETRQRFTIAHEIAHAILHAEDIEDGLTDNALLRSRLINAKERQADAFAADILMPEHLLEPLMAKPYPSIRHLADKFEVSPAAMAIRIGYLGYPY